MSSEPQCGEIGGCGVSANEYSCAHGAQINFRDLTPYLTYGEKSRLFSIVPLTSACSTCQREKV